MPRQARIDIPGLLQHVIVRGIERRNIFRNNADRQDFVDRFSKLLQETDIDCFAWALIPNHFHLLLRPNTSTLKQFMRRLLTGYAISFNKRYQRSGHLFQNRYKSIVCEEESYLLELVRYIHLNPLRAGLVKDLDALERFAWCGHGGLVGKTPLPGQSVDEVLGLFGPKAAKARTVCRQFIADGVEQGRRPELVGGGLIRSLMAQGASEFKASDERVLGSGDFVEELRRRDELREPLLAGMPLLELLSRVARCYGFDVEQVKTRSRDPQRSNARDLFCALAVRRLRFSGAEVGRVIGIGRSAVSHAVKRGEVWLKEEPGLEELLLR